MDGCKLLQTLSSAGRSKGMNGATSEGSCTNRHMISITLEAFLFITEDRLFNDFPNNGAMRASTGESTFATNVVSSSRSNVLIDSSGRAMTLTN